MTAFKKIALVYAHQRIPMMDENYIPDLTELCSLAAVVKDDVEWVTIPVTPQDRDPLHVFERFVRKRRPDLVGISCHTCGFKSGLEYARIAKHVDAYVVMGGYHPSAMPDEVLQSPHVDAVVRGEGEITFAELVKKGPDRLVRGLVFKDAVTGVTHNEERPVIEDLDSLPLPARGVRPERFGRPSAEYQTDTVYTSRGCLSRCTFCANHLVGKHWRTRSNENVMRELLSLTPTKKGKLKLVKFWDANFLTKPERVGELCALMIESGLNKRFRFSFESRASDITRAEHLMSRLREAGFVRVSIGMESPNRETLRRLRKNVSPEAMGNAAKLAAQSGIRIMKYFIVGHPHEHEQDILNYSDYSVSLGTHRQSALIFIMTPYPGTDVYEQYKAKNMIKSFDWDLYNNTTAVIQPNEMTPLRLYSAATAATMRHALLKYFRNGLHGRQLAIRFAKAAAGHTASNLLNRDHTSGEMVQALWEAIRMVRIDELREPYGRRGRRKDQYVLYVHCKDDDPMVLALVGQDGKERLIMQPHSYLGQGELNGKQAIHIDAEHLYRIAKLVSCRTFAHDLWFLHLGIYDWRLSWLPGAAKNLGRLAWVIMCMLGYQLRIRFGSGMSLRNTSV